MEEFRSTEDKKRKSRQNKALNNYAKYSGLGFQMGVIIAISVWGGLKLDELAGTETPVFTIVLSLLGVVTAIYTAIRDFIK